jgi:hypothetical protein
MERREFMATVGVVAALRRFLLPLRKRVGKRLRAGRIVDQLPVGPPDSRGKMRDNFVPRSLLESTQISPW